MLTAVRQLRISLSKVCVSMCVSKYICSIYTVYFRESVLITSPYTCLKA